MSEKIQNSLFSPLVTYNSITYHNGANNTFVFVTPRQTASKCRSNFSYSSKILRFTQTYLQEKKTYISANKLNFRGQAFVQTIEVCKLSTKDGKLKHGTKRRHFDTFSTPHLKWSWPSPFGQKHLTMQRSLRHAIEKSR